MDVSHRPECRLSSAAKPDAQPRVAQLENIDFGSAAGRGSPARRTDRRPVSLLRGLDPFNRALMMLYLDDRSYLEKQKSWGSAKPMGHHDQPAQARLRSELALRHDDSTDIELDELKRRGVLSTRGSRRATRRTRGSSES